MPPRHARFAPPPPTLLPAAPAGLSGSRRARGAA